ncbi:apolipoprotein N-acyltransferase [Desulfobacterales bacterium HSG16]|nr:apolipoprotein N-acyltransferase [Desulfobacterales bacterium HSG16]
MNRPMIWAIFSGIGYMLCFPPFSLWFFSFIILVPFFMALDKAKSLKKHLIYGMLWGAGFSIGTGYGIFYALLTHYEKDFWIAVFFFLLCVIIPYALLAGLFSTAYGQVKSRHPLFYILTIPCLWIVTSWLKAWIPLLIPWADIGYGVIPFLLFIQVADITGVYGVSFFLVMINAMFVVLISGSHRRMPIIIILAAICLPAAYGSFRISEIEKFAENKILSGQGICAAVVQGNFSLKERWSGMGFFHRVRTYLDLSRPENSCNKTKQKQPEVIVWPETVLNVSSKVNDALFSQLLSSLGTSDTIITGGLRKDKIFDGVYNSAFAVSGNGDLSWYDKHILLPYAERDLPGDNVLGNFYDAPSDFLTGVSPSVIDAPCGKFGISICLEILYPGHIRKSVQDGADVLVNISNDGWFGKTSMPYIHYNAAKMRAVENRRFVLRAANSGISGIIKPTGKTAEKTGLFLRSTVSTTITTMEISSIYRQLGDWILYMAIIWLMAVFARMLCKT